MAEEALTFFADILRSHADMISGENYELQRLKDELGLLRAFLRDASRKQAERLRELDLERLVKEVVYDMEDTLESWSIQMAAVTARNVIVRRFLIQRHKYALEREIKSIRYGRLEPLKRRIMAFGDLELVQKHPTEANEVPSEQINKEDPAIGPKKIVGFEDEAETLISYLMEETEELDVIAITGMPGIGKTTLARKIYENDTIRSEFPTRIWVDIPLDLCIKDLYFIILKHSCSEESYLEILNDGINDDNLIIAVRACLKKSRFLLVMDAVWAAESLRSIVNFLPKMGKVLITSRENHITRKSHVLRFLNEKESWDLLQLEVFGKLDECPAMLKSMGECIAKNCDGSPLAIVVVASSLVVTSSTEAAKDLTEKLWKEVSENVKMHVTDYGQHRLFSSVEWSYIKLPQHLQTCFLYLGVFPEGHEIPVWTLTRLWIAEGLVRDNGTVTLEETAEQNLYHLINRNLVMVGKTYPNGQIKTCRLHKLIYGFCKYKAGEQDLYQEIKMSGGGTSNRPNSHRLCIYSHLSEFLSSTPKGRRVRSILCLNKGDRVLHPKYASTIHKCFKLLRILECKCVNFTRFPKQLAKLMHLRYISLSCDDLVVIPETISLLCYLETLVVDTQSPSLELKANIWRMFKLRHLVTKAAIVLAIRGTGEARNNLQTLTRLAPACCTEDVSTRAPNLKALGIRGQLAALSAAESLRKLECLQHLKLINESASETPLHRRLHPDFFPPNLKRLTLSATYLEWECMSILGKIGSLEILKLKNNAFTGGSWNTDADGFLRLRFLFIGTTDLVSWEASAGCFPRLKWLVLNNCDKLHKIPSTLARSLDTLDVENLSESAVESAREIAREQKASLHEFKLSIRLGSYN